MSSRSDRYVHELDEARSAGNWDQVPELIRKLKKHASDRACLALTAEAEHAIVQASNIRPSTARPATARPTTATFTGPQITKYIALLSDATAKEKKHREDEFQAWACIGWIYWHLGDSDSALAHLTQDVEPWFAQLDGSTKDSAKWTKVCALRATYIKGTTQAKTGSLSDAEQTFVSSMPILASTSSIKGVKELRSWTELYVTGLCITSSKVAKGRLSNTIETETLSAFRSWAKFWDAQGANPDGGRAPNSDVSRRAVWKEYYALLSHILHNNLPFPTTLLTTTYAETSTKLQQRAELKKVENRYESLLLSEVQFPKAEDSSEEIEAFVDLVMNNWRMLCGSNWQDSDLGEGGSEGVSRGVLDILYRAATKTFHSTALLRHLFTVHLAVAEFDLAFKAFETYLDIVTKGKARVDKTGVLEPRLDGDEYVLRTTSEYIKALCRYGKRDEANKAKDMGKFFEDWLNKHHPAPHSKDDAASVGDSDSIKTAEIAPEVFALAWRSIGIGYAQWARLTFDGASRSDIQLKAIKCLRQALAPEYNSTTDIETLFALGTILAERRELASAIEVVKNGLLPRSSVSHSNGLVAYPGRFARERALIPLWHLLALLLSAKQDFLVAARSCEGAFEQFQDPKNLFGAEELGGTFRSEHLNEKGAPQNLGVVDDMDDWEKEGVLEVKMTQLCLIEVLEGPEVAVNASDELLGLYSRLFGEPQKELALNLKPSTSTTLVPPKSSAGTIRSIKGSIFGRTSRSVRRSQMSSLTEETTTRVPRPQTTQTTTTVAPKIQVTNENGNTAKHHRHAKDGSHHHEKLQKKDSVLRKKSASSLRNRNPSPNRGSSPPTSPTVIDGEKFFTPTLEAPPQFPDIDFRASQVGLAVSIDNAASAVNSPHDLRDISHERPLPPSTQQLSQTEATLRPSDSQDTRVPESSGSSHSSPAPRFPKDQRMRRRTAMLIKVWLLISGFYRRASLHDDAKGAIEEASKLVQELATDVSKEYSTALSVEHSGMGGGKTVNELWADIFAERGYLAVAESAPHTALSHFESALTRFADHPSAIVGLSNILLDIYTEDLLPPSSIPKLVLPGTSASTLNTGTSTPNTYQNPPEAHHKPGVLKASPLGIACVPKKSLALAQQDTIFDPTPSTTSNTSKKYQHIDRLAARDRAFGLLSNLTKLGSGWNYSEAWFALARAYELGGQEGKAKEVLWWCVELEDARAVRDWQELGEGGYVL